jgi:hypothetical protein
MMKPSKLKRKPRAHLSSLIVLMMPVLSILLVSCSGGLKLTSEWQPREMNIDGTDSQWQRGLYYEKESDMVYGVRNDENFLYVFLKTQNRSTQMQMMRQGFTVWFDRENGKNQTFGLHYPMGRKEPRAGGIPDSNDDRFHSFLDQEFPELEILGPKKEDVQRFSALEAPGIRVKLGRTREALVYELRVPLNKASEHPFAIEPISSRRLGIEFETGDFKEGQNKGGMRVGGGHNRGGEKGEGNPVEGVSTGGDGRPHGSGRQGSRFSNQEKTKPMELWLSVQLAKTISQ